MKERPIVFNGEMVRSILAGRKTQTRQVVKPQPQAHHWQGMKSYKEWWTYLHVTEGLVASYWRSIAENPHPECDRRRSPYGGIGDHLWVRETWGEDVGDVSDPTMIGYRADNGVAFWDGFRLAMRYEKDLDVLSDPTTKWRPSIHMPRWASRITLEVVGVRIERVQDITPMDAINEGCDASKHSMPTLWFKTLWDSINAKRGYGWDTNPWVWVIEFRRTKP